MLVFALYTIVWHSAIHIEEQSEARRQRFEILLLLLLYSITDKATLCVNKIRPFGTICEGRNTLFYIMLHKHTSECLQESFPNLHICLQTTTISELNSTREVSEGHLRFMQINTVVWELFWHIPYISVGLYIHIHVCLQFCEQIVKNVTGKKYVAVRYFIKQHATLSLSLSMPRMAALFDNTRPQMLPYGILSAPWWLLKYEKLSARPLKKRRWNIA